MMRSGEFQRWSEKQQKPDVFLVIWRPSMFAVVRVKDGTREDGSRSSGGRWDV